MEKKNIIMGLLFLCILCTSGVANYQLPREEYCGTYGAGIKAYIYEFAPNNCTEESCVQMCLDHMSRQGTIMASGCHRTICYCCMS